MQMFFRICHGFCLSLFLLICSTSTSKLNVLVTKLNEFLAHAAVEDSGETSTSKDAEEGTVDATGDRNRVLSHVHMKHGPL